jgi:16S rRNA (guanine527-N7)-methyltransferase
MTLAAALDRGLRELALPLPPDAAGKLAAFVGLLAKWNRTFNLTAVRDPQTMVTHHLLDSLAVVAELPDGSLADVGAGAGFPGIPIAIAQPQRRVTLNDANGKKCAFLRQAAIELALPNVDLHEGRVELWRPRERFDVVICRGLAELRKFIASCRHLLAAGGVLAAMKGAYPGDELEAVPADCDCRDVRRLEVPLLRAERHLVLCTPKVQA